ncbi:MAG: insulinase family protein [Deltaproteobacteria bacterium]|nr:insulinase family protein [Deltaproteobacteria bacterium]
MKRLGIPSIVLASLVVSALASACGGSQKPTPMPGPDHHSGPAALPTPTPTTVPAQPETSMQPMIKVTQPAAPQELAFPDDAFRAAQPKAGPPRPFRLPKVKPFTLKNGIKVYLVEQHALPIVSMDLNFDGGSMLDPKGKEGLASVCMSMLTEGTDKLDKIQYAEALADVASNVSAYAADDSAGLSLSSLTKHLDVTFALFADTLQRPGFRASDFDRMVKRRIEAVRQSKGNPASVAGRVTGGVLYGLEHPFGTVVTETSLAAITLDDCKQHVAKYLKPGNARLFVVGDLTEAQVRAYFEKGELAAWKGKPGKLPALPPPSTLKGRIFFVHVPSAAQSQVSLLQFGPKRTAADYFANTMMASVFGGSFSSRINMNLRENKGYSYGARGGFGYSKQYGTFNANASVRTDSTYQTLLEIDREIKELQSAKTPIKLDELDREKQGAILGLPGRFATAQAALGQYRGLVYFGLPLDYYNNYVAKVGRVNEAQIKAAASKHLKPANAVYIVVGDGDAKMIVRDPATNKDVPLTKDGKQLTLREALGDLAQRGDVGAGGLIELDTDGRPLR